MPDRMRENNEPLDPKTDVPGMNTPGIKNPRAINVVDQQKRRGEQEEGGPQVVEQEGDQEGDLSLNGQDLPSNASQAKPHNQAGVPYTQR